MLILLKVVFIVYIVYSVTYLAKVGHTVLFIDVTLYFVIHRETTDPYGKQDRMIYTCFVLTISRP